MRISFFSNFHQPCGIADYSEQLAEALSKLAEVKIVHSPLSPHHPYSIASYPWHAHRFRRTSRELNDADICHIQHEYSFWGGVRPLRNLFPYFASAITVPVVMTAHEIVPTPFRTADFTGSLKWLSACLAPWASRYSSYVNAGMFQGTDCTIVHTGQQRQMLLERGVSADRVTVIPHGIPSCRVPSLAVADTALRLGLVGLRLLTIIGFISPRKGYELALDALARLPDDIVLVIAGGCRTAEDEAYSRALREQVDRSGLTRRVVFTGYLGPDELHGVVKASSAVLAPFNAVAGSGTISIAFASGIPVIASNLPPLAELNESARAMLLFTAGSAEDLLLKIQQLFANDHLAVELKSSALRYACRNSMAAVAERTYKLYEKILERRAQLRFGRM